MLYFIKPTVTFSELNDSNIIITDINNNPVDGITITEHDDRRLLINKETWSQQIKEAAYTIALETNQLIKLDTNRTKCRLVPSLEIFKAKNSSNNIKNVGIQDIIALEDLNISTTKLDDLDFDPRLFLPYKTGTDIDTFISYDGGITPGTNILVTGDPGVGKSSNLMDLLCQFKKHNSDIKVLYISAEMNEIEVKRFQKYYPSLGQIDFLYLMDYVIEDKGVTASQALQSVLLQGWNVVIMDSLIEVMSMVQEDLQLSTPKVERWLLSLLNAHNKGHNKLNVFTSFLAIQQKNKGGQYVGSKRLEHMTSAFLQLKWDEKEKGKRYMMFSKNRNGKENVRLYYTFTGNDIKYDIKKYNDEVSLIQKSSEFKDHDLEEMSIESFFDQLKEQSGLSIDN